MNVYFIKCIDDNEFIKIGVANNVKRRLDELQTGCPYPLKVVAVIPCSSKANAYETEKNFHKAFEKSRIGGEWFKRDIDMSAIEASKPNIPVKRDINKALFARREIEEQKEIDRLDIQLLMSSPL